MLLEKIKLQFYQVAQLHISKATNRTLESFTIVSSMGYVVLSGKMHVDKHETTFTTPVSKLVCSTLSLMWIFLRCKEKNTVTLK
jgi:hypothetical protein